MSYRYPIMPDEVAVTINFLASDPYIQQYTPVTIAGDLKGWVYPQRRIVVSTSGGTLANPKRVSSPRIDINVYAEEKVIAKDIALAAVAAILSMKNYVDEDNSAVVVEVEPTTPADITDQLNSHPRFVFDATIFIRPL